jgi:hypothetical protein
LADISFIIWEILRLRRCKALIVNAARRNALQHLLEESAPVLSPGCFGLMQVFWNAAALDTSQQHEN